MSTELEELRKRLAAARAADNEAVRALALMAIIGLVAGALELADPSLLVAAALVGVGAWWWVSR